MRSKVFFLIIILIGIIIPIPVLNADGENWLTGWNYRKSHTIIGSSGGAQTDYQIGIKVYYGDGADGTEVVNGVTFGKVYLDSECKTDFGDIRFTATDGDTELDYWIESKTDSNNAVIWVEVDSIPEDPDTDIIYIYYGNDEATTTSSGVDTAYDSIFDDFEGYVVDDPIPIDGIWDTNDAVCENDPDAEGHGKTAYLTKASAQGLLPTDAFTKLYPIAVRFWIRRTSNQNRDGYMYHWEDATLITTAWWNAGDHEYYDGTYKDFNPVLTSTFQTWEQWETRIYSGDFHIINDGVDHDGAIRNAVTIGINKWELRSGAGGVTGAWYINDFWVRKFADPEPVHDEWGIEEIAPSPPSDPDLLFGAGFNSSSPYVELHWNHSLIDVQFFEVQNSSDSISWEYLGQSTTANYTDYEVFNGTARYYRVRACNQTGGSWFNSSFCHPDFEIVYFIMGENGDNGIIVEESDAPWIALAIILSIIAGLLFTRIKR